MELDNNIKMERSTDTAQVTENPPLLRIIFLVSCFILVSSLVLYAYRALTNPEVAVVTEEVENQNVTKTWSEQNRVSTTEGLNVYITELDAELEDTELMPHERKVLLLKKAIALGANRVNLQAPSMNNVEESTGILKSLFEAEAGSYKEDVSKYATISAYIGLLNSTCFLPDVALSLPSTYPQLYNSLLQKGLHPKAALLLSIHDFAYSELDERFENDASTVANRAYITALYLYSFGDRYNDVVGDETLTDTALYSKLQTDLLKSPKLEKILYTGVNRAVIDPALRLAFVNDIVKTYKSNQLSIEENDAIDLQYTEVFGVINSYGNGSDSVSDAISRVMNTLMYFDSLHRRWSSDELNPEVVSMLIDTFIENATSSKEVREMVTSYFTLSQSDGEDWFAIRAGFMKASAKYEKLRNFFSTELGIDLPVEEDAI
jgi:hypothetical protein